MEENEEVGFSLSSEAIDLNPNCDHLHADLAQANIKLSNFTVALADANKAFELDPSMSEDSILNFLPEEKGNIVVEDKRQLYLLLDVDYSHYAFYCIGDPKFSSEDDEQLTNTCFDEPFLCIDKKDFPNYINIAVIGSRIFMVGGSDSNNIISNKVFIYHIVSKSWESGPCLNSPKYFPHLITIGSKLFALSILLNFRCLEDNALEGNPRFEVLDTDDLGKGWRSLTFPPLEVSQEVDGAFAFAAVDGYIFVSVGHSGTWRFELDKETWAKVSGEALPFYGKAESILHAPSICCAYSLRSDTFCGFHFRYHNSQLVIDEIEIQNSNILPMLTPPLEYCQRYPVVLGPGGRVYFVTSGVDNQLNRNRYVHVYAHELKVSDKVRKLLKVNLWGGLQRCSKKQMHIGIEKENKAVEIEEEEQEGEKKYVSFGVQASSGKKVREERVDMTPILKLTGHWRRSFFGGPECDPFIYVVAAFSR